MSPWRTPVSGRTVGVKESSVSSRRNLLQTNAPFVCYLQPVLPPEWPRDLNRYHDAWPEGHAPTSCVMVIGSAHSDLNTWFPALNLRTEETFQMRRETSSDRTGCFLLIRSSTRQQRAVLRMTGSLWAPEIRRSAVDAFTRADGTCLDGCSQNTSVTPAAAREPLS